ncbi:hypothetical protein CLHOM_30730 [Clostridium homopropionicum DSM 5847]|uniref:DUF3892 domain-containing protein n=1 Tax=Clostridium homopropionicum DSM 5847 TaxID=1121318 RepID=A0A0L6Z5F9_9CLOT|nr:DUF3892 domain-containing protein [Clostridium homopropionicum]KOA18195.1 hypothetical protein CLHOM_30730 [Clostridium homopropionicum DSM 5847]SFF71479.1 hypothetical protein SAMN04488501_101408 [Clostridium homopropionicum]
MYMDFSFAHIITDIVRDPNNNIIAYKLENGQTISKGEALDLSKQTAIKGISEGVYNHRGEFFSSVPQDELCNLTELPVIEIDREYIKSR